MKSAFARWSLVLVAALLLLEAGARISLSLLKETTAPFNRTYEIKSAAFNAKQFLYWSPVSDPFFGYVSSGPKANNMGFHSEYNYPYLKRGNEFVVGIFGGSVAEIFHIATLKSQFKEKLKKALPEIGDREVVILNFALGCYKQPQQFIISSYFQETFDVSINIDGFNELNFNDPQQRVESPCWTDLLYADSLEGTELKRKVMSWRNQQSLLTYMLTKTPVLSKSAAVYLGWKAFVSWREREITAVNQKLQNVAAKSDFSANRDLIREGAENWEKYTRLQAQIAKASGHKAIFLLQPNQHVKNTKPFSSEELALWKKSEFFNEEVARLTRGFSYLQDSVRRLKWEGISVYDLTGLFSETPETVYADSCCHLNDRGNELLENRLIQILTERRPATHRLSAVE